tara:strand:- start:20273 stop:20674 length:402 start_codon:yes stop_codon:yes gene_type:complete
MSFDDMRLKVKCPCCVEEGNEEDTLILLGDERQSMQCVHCGYASSSDYKDKLTDDLDDKFKSICKNIGGRNWLPGVFTSENYYITPDVKDGKLIWHIITKLGTESTKVEMPHFSDAFNIVRTMESHSGNEIQQ